MMPMVALHLDADTRAAVEAAAAWRGLSVEDYTRTVIGRAAAMDRDLAAFVQEGIDAADRGELVSQDQMEAWFESRHRPAAAE